MVSNSTYLLGNSQQRTASFEAHEEVYEYLGMNDAFVLYSNFAPIHQVEDDQGPSH